MTKPVWKSGPPPSLGWWPASAVKNENFFRWWNGKCWSQGCTKGYSEVAVAINATNPTNMRGIKWTTRPKSWPARSMT